MLYGSTFILHTKKSINWFWALLVLVFSVLAVTLPWFGLSRETLHVFLFPLMLISVWRLPRSSFFRMPRVLVVLGLCIWTLSIAHAEGLFTLLPSSGSAFISQLADDPMGKSAREITARFNEIARTYHLTPIEFTGKQFSRGHRASNRWYLKHPSAGVVVTGNSDWLRVISRPENSIFKINSTNDERLDPVLSGEFTRLGLKLNHGVQVLTPPGFSSGLLLGATIPPFDVPGAMPELGRHFLAWFAQGFITDDKLEHWNLAEHLLLAVDPDERKEQFVEQRRNFLAIASEIEGPWKSPVPRAAARSLIGLTYLTPYFEGKLNEPAEFACSLAEFSAALSFVHKRENAELNSLIFNNSAIARLLLSSDAKDTRRAKKWFIRAMRSRNQLGTPTLGAKLAYINLLALERNGLL